MATTDAESYEHSREQRTIAVDGLSGAGKSSLSRAVARHLGWSYLDTGATYRAVTLAALRAGLVDTGASWLRDQDGVVTLAREVLDRLDLSTRPESTRVLWGTEDVTEAIRGQDVTSAVSAVSAEPRLRAILVGWQRRTALDVDGCVAEGRDVGTVVLPSAPLKVWLTAAPEARASRRAADLQPAGVSLSAVRASLARRDSLDSSRAADPALPAPDAVVVDSSGLALEAVVDAVLQLADSRGIRQQALHD